MNEIISALQSAIALNRQQINESHQMLNVHKELYNFDKEAHLYWIRKDSAKIAQLIRIQKMLKKQLAKEISEENVKIFLRQYDTPKPYVEEL